MVCVDVFHLLLMLLYFKERLCRGQSRLRMETVHTTMTKGEDG